LSNHPAKPRLFNFYQGSKMNKFLIGLALCLVTIAGCADLGIAQRVNVQQLADRSNAIHAQRVREQNASNARVARQAPRDRAIHAPRRKK
jgi:hypothetical protein